LNASSSRRNDSVSDGCCLEDRFCFDLVDG
jgi:hypothetical protein